MGRSTVWLAVLALGACANGDLREAGYSPEPTEREYVIDLGARGVAPGFDVKPLIDEALAEALAQLAIDGSRPVVLEFPPGDLELAHPGGAAIEIGDISGPLVLRGAGADRTSLVFGQFDHYGILLRRAHRVTIEQLHLTRPGLYTTQGDVTAPPSAGRIRFALHPGFPDPLPIVEAPNALDNDRTLIRFRGPADDPELAPNSVSYKLCPAGRADCTTAIVQVGEREYEAILDDPDEVADLQVGDQVALKAKAGRQTVRAESCDDLVVRDVRFTRNSAVTLAIQDSSNRTLVERIRVERAAAIEGRVPFFAGPGGGPQITALHDGPIIRDNVIVGTTDDAIAVFSHDRNSPMRGARIERNTIRDGQGRGINITQSSDGICAENRIVRCQNASIQLKSNQASTGSTAAVVRWQIVNNTLVQPWTDPAIYLTRENGSAGEGKHDAIVIANNVIEEAALRNPVLHVRNTASLEVHDNTIVSFSTESDVPGRGLPDGPMPIVFVEEAELVTGEGNACAVATSRPGVIVDPRNLGSVDLAWSGTAP